MRKQYFQIVCLVLMTLAAGLSAIGAPSGLNVIPTADVLERGVVSMETESTGTGLPWSGDCAQFVLFQAGVGSGIELGADKCLDDPDSWVNFKWRLPGEIGGAAIAFGTQAVNDSDRPQPYLVTTKSLGTMRLHTGAIDIDRKIRWMVGLDHPLGTWATLQADYITGDENAMTFGLAINLSSSLSLTLARSIGNSAETGNGHVLNLAWARPLK